MTDITQRDLYELLAVEETASSSEISTAFRKKALTCHPDKYPNDEEKKNLFILIKQTLELLTDEQARKAYDATRKQKKLQKERLSQMDDKRKKFKQDLERNEQKAAQTTTGPVMNKNNDQRLKAEIERLRREGNRLVDEEMEKLRVIIEEDKQRCSSNHVNVIVKYLPDSTIYSDEELRILFGKYGTISTIINQFPKRALLEFNVDHISSFIENEKGFPDRPFASVKIQKQKTTTTTTSKPPPVVDLTKPELEDYEAMIFKKIAARTAAT